MNTYVVRRARTDVALDPDASGGPWRRLPELRMDCFPWHEAGVRQLTTAKLCYTPERLCVQFQCEDRHISARQTAMNSSVCRDSCVEFFASPPEDTGNYFNLEINCCGVIHLGHGPERLGRRLADARIVERIRVFHSVPGPTKEESPEDKGWTLRVGLPFGALGEFLGRRLTVAPGVRWRANFYRCGGITDPQFACWSPVGTPGPDFHQPGYFGTIEFAE